MAETIVIAGGMAQRPHYAGHTWQFLQYLLGLKGLGWEVLFLDRLEPEMCVDEAGRPVAVEDSVPWKYFRRVMRHFGLEDSFAILYNGGTQYLGLSRTEVLERTNSAALLLNVMGFLTDEGILAAAPRRVFLDTDPGIPQIWHERGLADVFHGHDDFVTIGENIGRPECEIPTCGRKWITMRQPVVLDLWPAHFQQAGGSITSVVSWRGPFGPLEYQGKSYGLRVHEFRKFVELPARTGASFELALDIDPVEIRDLELLNQNGWSLSDPKAVAAEPLVYQQFIERSLAEFMVAKNIYVQTRSGWFSDRSTCYLASGKPVIAQDTGLGHIYPVGEGLLTFSNLDEAVAAVAEVRGNYAHHCRAARSVAAEFFDSRRVFSSLLTDLGIN